MTYKNNIGTPFVDEVDGKVVPWNDKKKGNQHFAKVVKPLLFEKYDKEKADELFSRINSCAEQLVHSEDIDGNLKLRNCYFCRNRFCPLCAWRKSLKDSFYLYSVLEECKKEYKSCRFLFLTLTLKDTGVYTADDIKARLNDFKIYFRRLMHDSRVKSFVLGSFRKFEVTVHEDKFSSTGFRFHIHMHVLLVVRGRYFVNKNLYLKHSDWVDLFQRHCHLDYRPMVNVQAINAKKNINKAICELSKYTTKDTDYLGFSDDEKNQRVLKILMESFKNVHDIAFGGICRKAKAKIKISENDLVHLSEEKESGKVVMRLVFSSWINKKRKYYVRKKTDYQEVDLKDQLKDKIAKTKVKLRHEKV